MQVIFLNDRRNSKNVNNMHDLKLQSMNQIVNIAQIAA